MLVCVYNVCLHSSIDLSTIKYYLNNILYISAVPTQGILTTLIAYLTNDLTKDIKDNGQENILETATTVFCKNSQKTIILIQSDI